MSGPRLRGSHPLGPSSFYGHRGRRRGHAASRGGAPPCGPPTPSVRASVPPSGMTQCVTASAGGANDARHSHLARTATPAPWSRRRRLQLDQRAPTLPAQIQTLPSEPWRGLRFKGPSLTTPFFNDAIPPATHRDHPSLEPKVSTAREGPKRPTLEPKNLNYRD